MSEHDERRVAIVTGASRGLGPAVARRLAADGYDLALVARSAEGLEAVAAAIRGEHGVAVKALAADLATPDGRARAIHGALDAFGQIDVLVNNAAVTTTKRFQEMSEEDVERQLQLNLTAPVDLVRRALPHMLERGTGHVVNVSTILTKMGAFPRTSVYSSAKTGLEDFTATLREELRGTGVSASVVLPGAIADQGILVDMKGRIETVPKMPEKAFIGSEAVADRVALAIRRDKAEVLAAPGAAFMTRFPGLAGSMFRRMGMMEFMQQVAEADLRSGRELADAP